MKLPLATPVALALLMTTGCSELKELADQYEAEQAAKEANVEEIRNANIDQPIASLSVNQISDEFESNSVVAENKYMNKPIEVSGYIGSVDDSMFDEESVNITITGGDYSLSSISCSKPRNSPLVQELRKGMYVAVRGVVTSEEMGIGLSRCKFWSFAEKSWIGS